MADIRSSNRDNEGTDGESEHLLPHDPERAESGEREMRVEETKPVDTWARSITLAGVAILVLTTWSLILIRGPSTFGWFAFHPPLQTLALGIFTYGILTLQPTSQPETKAAGLIRHQTAMFLVGFPTIALGTSAVVLNKYMHGSEHATTLHGSLGFTCIFWLLGQIFLGAGSVWNGGSLFGGGAKAKAVWKYHRASGYILFPLMLFTAHLGGGEFSDGLVAFSAYTVAPLMIFGGLCACIRFSKMKFW